jgi:hypothetical protein
MATDIKYDTEAADAGGVSVKALLGTAGVSDGLAARVTAADADGSGVLSLAELVSVFRSEDKAIKDKRTMRRCGAVPRSPCRPDHEAPASSRNQGLPPMPPRRIAIAAAVLVAVLCAAMTGITYAVVALSKESRVGANGVMVVKGSDTPVSTGAGGCWGAAGGLPGAAGGCCGTIWILIRSHQMHSALDPACCPSHQPRRPGDVHF